MTATALYRLGWRVGSLAGFCALWEGAGQWPISPAFPPFSETFAALVTMLADGELILAYGPTLLPLAIGVFLCGLVGVGFGVAMGLSRSMEWFFLPVFIIVQSAPMAAVIPLITFLYGIGLASKVLAVVLMATPVIVLNSYQGIRNTPETLLEMHRAFLGTHWQAVVKIILPAASNIIFAGLRLGVSAGFIGIVLAELLITPTGIGDLITYYRSIARYDAMFAVIVSIIALAAVTVGLLQHAERVLFRPDT